MKGYDLLAVLACSLASSSGSHFGGPPFPVSTRCSPVSMPCRGAVRFPSRLRALGDPGGTTSLLL